MLLSSKTERQHGVRSAVWRSYARYRLSWGLRADARGDFIGAFPHLRSAARAGIAEAQFRLGEYYEKGQGAMRSPGDAAEWYRRAAAQQHPGAEFALSLMYLHGQEVRRITAWYRTAKELDEITALRNSQALFPHGIEVVRDYKQALHWSLAAAQNGRVEAQANVGLLLLQGLGCQADYGEARRWLSVAAESGNSEAQYGMGMLYAGGLGVEKDLAAALRWYEAASAQNHTAAEAALGYLHGFGAEEQRDGERAEQLLRRASDHGSAVAPYYLGMLYLRQDRAVRDFSEVESCFLRGAQRGYVPAMLALAGLYTRGESGKAAADKAVNWYRSAAEAGDAEAQFQLGVLYMDGKGGVTNPTAALECYRRAADQGHALAQHNYAEMLLRGGDPAAAAFWFAAAAAQELAESQVMMGDLYAAGRGVERSLTIARDWYQKAANHGLREAAIKLERSARLRPPAQERRSEPVQLVIWNVDEAFWGVASDQSLSVSRHLDIVVQLAKRKIISLLGSNTSVTQARQFLVEQGVWEYFVFQLPGCPVALGELVAIIDAVITPPGSVLLVDDHPSNRSEAEAKHGLQVAGSSVARQMLDDPRFAGTNDPTLSQVVRSVLLGETSSAQEQDGTPWYRIAAEAGNAEAQSILGWALLTGDGCEADAVASLSWFRKSAEAGFVPAQLQLGLMCRDGVGGPADKELAAHWLQRAAEGGNADAQALLSSAPQAAVPWYRIAAQDGNAEAQNILGWAYLTGDQCERDEAIAASWFEKSAQAGFALAQLQLGSMYYDGVGVPKDPALALEWYQKAAQAGNADAQTFVAARAAENNSVTRRDDAPVPVPPQSAPAAKVESVRLVVWDLDDTFWRGTLAEGGIEAYIKENHDLVVTLAQRGIMSSICSRNDFAAVRSVLEERGLWQYFIFPSVNWAPKGERVAAIVEAVQLRSPTVLFVDDNPLNRAAVAAAVPGIQIADPGILAGMLENPLFEGKDDRALTRLAQYKLLQKRDIDRQASEGGDEAFLRGADIRVIIDTDIAANLDRTIELINRTNQLNFTKRRLPEQPEAARAKLLKELSPFYSHGGLVRVIDKYGDYGYCGYYRLEGNTLVDYCFSCRILGMGVEPWLYERLGRPKITVVGEVLTDLTQQRRVDWITLTTSAGSAVAVAERTIPEVRLRGGCDLDALAHYFRLVAENVRSETNRSRPPLFVRMDTTVQLVPALDGVDPSFLEAASQLGLAPEDFESQFLTSAAPGSILVYSPWADIYQAQYRHKTAGFRIPINVHIHTDLTQISDEELAAALISLKVDAAQQAKITSIVQILRSQYVYEFHTPVPVAVEMIRRLFERIPRGARLFFILPHEWYKDGDSLLPRAREYNQAVRELAAHYPLVSLVPMNDVVHGPGEMQEAFDHFDRIVYFRLYQKIMQAITALEHQGAWQ